MFFKIDSVKNFANLTRKIHVLESLFNKIEDLQLYQTLQASFPWEIDLVIKYQTFYISAYIFQRKISSIRPGRIYGERPNLMGLY